MHKKYAAQGLVIVTVSLDALEDRDRAVKFLQAKQAAFSNVLLDEPAAFWQDKLRFVAPPCYYVFNRQGKWTQFKSEQKEIDYEAMEKLLVNLLKEK